MNDHTDIPSTSNQNGLDHLKQPALELAQFAMFAGAILLRVREAIIAAVERAERDHHRGSLLAACRVRHKWRAGDVHALRSLAASQVALRRVSRLKGRGRPLVKRYRPLGEIVISRVQILTSLFAERTDPSQRRKAFFMWPWWKHHVEALYRGELEAYRAGLEVARTAKLGDPYLKVEERVATALGMSQSRVHAVCSEIRALRRDDAEAANFPPMVITEYEGWMMSGEHPRHR